jgi:hypothetical protein
MGGIIMSAEVVVVVVTALRDGDTGLESEVEDATVIRGRFTGDFVDKAGEDVAERCPEEAGLGDIEIPATDIASEPLRLGQVERQTPRKWKVGCR